MYTDLHTGLNAADAGHIYFRKTRGAGVSESLDVRLSQAFVNCQGLYYY